MFDIENDEFQEMQYSAVHFDSRLVLQLIKQTIGANRTSQKYVLITGLCNNNILNDFDDKMEIRNMDEVLEIERQLGEIQGIVSMQYGGEEPTHINKEDIEWEIFPEPEVVEEVKVVGEGEGDEQVEPPAQPADEDEDPNKPPPFIPKDYDWTISNKKP